MNEKVLNIIGDKLENLEAIASSIANSKWAQNVIPSTKELNQTIAGNSKLNASIYNENIQKNIGIMLRDIGVPEKEATKIAKSVKANNYNDIIDSFSDNVSKYTDKPIDKIKEKAKSVTEKEISKEIDQGMIPTKEKALKYPAAYFMNSDKSVKNTRIGTAVGAYAGVAVGGRFLSGGTLTNDSYGKKDIAGIPFI